MIGFSSKQIQAPENWQDFETLCCDLWARILGDQNTQKNGRSGQPQGGVDIYGREGKADRWIGIQCKGKDGRFGHRVTKEELRAEVEKAYSFQPPLAEFILATTADTDAKIQALARELTQSNEAQGLFAVHVLGWPEIVRRIGDYEDLVEKYYPGNSLRLITNEKKLDSLIDESLKHRNNQEETAHSLSDMHSMMADLHTAFFAQSDGGTEKILDEINQLHNNEIDTYRDILNSGKASTARSLLLDLKERSWAGMSDHIKFRITTNIAACNLALGEERNAVQGFRTAFQYDEDNEIANANLVLSDIIEENIQEAHNKARSLLERFPYSEVVLSYYYLTLPADSGFVNTESLVPNELAQSGVIAHSLYLYHKRVSNQAEASHWIERAYEYAPDLFEIRLAYATHCLENILLDDALSIGFPPSPEQISALNKCQKFFSELFEERINSESVVNLDGITNNLSLIKFILDEHGDALSLIDRALLRIPNNEALLEMRLSFCVNVENFDEAVRFMERNLLPTTFRITLLRAYTLQARQEYQKGREVVEEYLQLTSIGHEKDILESLLVDFLNQTSGYESARSHAECLALYKSGIHVNIVLSKICRSHGDESEAKECVARALSNLKKASAGEKFLVAEEAYHCGLLYQAKNIFAQLTKMDVDSPALRRLVACLHELDDRLELQGVFDSISEEVANLPFYLKYSSAHYVKTGDYIKAEEKINSYISDHPSDLDAILNKAWLLNRQNKTGEAARLLANVSEISSQPRRDQLRLAFALLYVGRQDDAIKIGYRLRREARDDPDVHLKYIGIILSSNKSIATSAFSQVEPGTSVVVNENDKNSEYYICDDNEERLTDSELSIDHPISISLLGHCAGDEVQYQATPYTHNCLQIVQIKNKYLYLFHETMNNFAHRFHNVKSMFKIDLGTEKNGGFDFSPIFRSIDQRHSHVMNGLAIYKEHPLPLGALATYLGVNPVDLWFGLQSDGDSPILCAHGTQSERDEAISIVDRGGLKYVVDPLTAIHIIDLGIGDILEELLGKLSITRSALDLIDSAFDDESSLLGDQSSIIIGKQGDKYVKEVKTQKENAQRTRYLRSVRESIVHLFSIVPAIGKPSESPEINQFLEELDRPFVDTIYAAQDEDFCLLSDDLRLRGVAHIGWSIESIWIQPVLMSALERGLMDHRRYIEIITQYIRRGFEFISVDSNFFFILAEFSSFKVDDEFRAACSTLGHPDIDVRSGVKVALGGLTKIWSTCRDVASNDAYLYTFLNGLTCDGASKNTEAIVQFLYKNPLGVAPAHRFKTAIKRWVQGHFLSGIL